MAEEKNKVDQVFSGMVGLAILFGAGALAYWIYPEGMADTPLSQLTLNMIGKAIGSVVIFLTGLAIAGSFWD